MKKHYLLNPDDYFTRFFELRKIYRNDFQAWDHLEYELWQEYKMNKYSSFESFRHRKSEYLRTKK